MMRDEFTRRAWILRLGGATILTGFSGSGLDAQESGASESGKLPPGLYQPSLDHLAHAPKGKPEMVLISSEGTPAVRLHTQGPDFMRKHIT